MEYSNINKFIEFILEIKSKTNKEIGLFWDNGYGEEIGEVTPIIDIILDGDGQHPIGSITENLYKELLDKRLINENTLITYKPRKYHKILM